MKRRLITMAIAAACAFAFAQHSRADEHSGWEVQEVYVHTFTRHSHGNEYLNDRNWGQGAVLRNHIVIGGYRNSIYQNSRYIGYKYDLNQYVGVIGGLIDGYVRHKAIPFGVIVFTAPIGRHVRVHLNVLPAGRQNIANLSVGWGF